MTLEEIVKRIEEFQTQNDRHFGISEFDFRNLFVWLIWGIIGGEDLTPAYPTLLTKVNLHDVTLDILKYQDAYFNDEGEHWRIRQDQPVYIPYLYDRNEEEFNTAQAIRKKTIEFFQELKDTICQFIQVQAMLVRLGFSYDILFRCSRPGNNS